MALATPHWERRCCCLYIRHVRERVYARSFGGVPTQIWGSYRRDWFYELERRRRLPWNFKCHLCSISVALWDAWSHIWELPWPRQDWMFLFYMFTKIVQINCPWLRLGTNLSKAPVTVLSFENFYLLIDFTLPCVTVMFCVVVNYNYY